MVLGSRGANQITTSIDDPSRPQAFVDAATFDFGEMTNSEIRDHIFTVTNNGQQDLVLSRVSTSCDCTYAYIEVAGETSPQFTMHGDTRWSAALETGESARVRVVYEPAIMPVRGAVTRTVSVTSNDPQQPSIVFTINANVTD